MDLDKYRRPATTQSDENSATPLVSQHPPAPTLGNAVDSLRQKTNRYRDYVHQEAESAKTPESETSPASFPTLTEAAPPPDQPTTEVSKGNRFKSDSTLPIPRKQTVRPPISLKKREPSPLNGVKIVYLDEAMREEYIQIAGYLMLKYRVKLTMTAYFCFLHDQAVTQQSDETFLNTLAQFVKRDGGATNP